MFGNYRGNSRTRRLPAPGGAVYAALRATTVALLLCSSAARADVKVAFIGDQSISEDAQAVLQLISQEGADLLLIQGDLGYTDNAADTWENHLVQNLGSDFPVLTVVGNHENFEWPAYKQYIESHVERIDELSCEGDIGVKALCRFRELEVVQVAVGVHEVDGIEPFDNYDTFIEQQFADSDATWRICSWHKNQTLMQVGGKPDATGWQVYEACLAAGALVATGHEHSYSRTHLLNSFSQQSIVHTNDHLELDHGQSFAFVSGLGGKNIREQQLSGDWWAAVYTSTQNAGFGALFCTFASTTASCYFKDIAGAVPDTFTLESRLGGGTPAASTGNRSSGALAPVSALLLGVVLAGLLASRRPGRH